MITAMPQSKTAPGSTRRGRPRTRLDWPEVSTTGFRFGSLARIEMRSSSSASQDTMLRKKSRLPCAPRNWLEAKSAVPTTTRRAFGVFFAEGPPRGHHRHRQRPRLLGRIRSGLAGLEHVLVG